MAAAPPSPSDLIQLPFARSALEELLLLAVAGGLLGSWIVLRRLAFFSHAAGTATFPGLAAAEAAGFSPRLAAFAAAFAYAGGVARGRQRTGGDPADAGTALLLVAALAAGTVLASDVGHSGAALDRLLFGTLVGIGGDDLALSGVAAVLTIAATVLLGAVWTASGFDREGAAHSGLPVGVADLLLLALVAATVVATLPAVGVLLVTSLLVVPAATARLLTRRIGALLAAAVAVAATQGAAGLYLALWLDVPPGPAIAALGAVVYGAVAVVR